MKFPFVAEFMRHTLIAILKGNQRMTRKLVAIKKDVSNHGNEANKRSVKIFGGISTDSQSSVEGTTKSVD